MRIVFAISRNPRTTNSPLTLEALERLVISRPQRKPTRGHARRLFHLRPEKRRDDLARQEARSQIHPSVLVDLSPEELFTICTFFPDDFGPLHQALIVDQ